MIAARFDARRFLVVICLVGLGTVLFGLGPAGAAERQLFMAVTDPSGEPVLDVRAEEVAVSQDGVTCEVSSVQPESGMKIALLVDNSEGADGSLNPLREGLTNFLNTLPPQHEIGLFTIANQVRRRVDFTTDRSELQEQVDTIFIDRNTGAAVMDGLFETWDRRFDDDDAWPVFVLVVHDGPETSGAVQQDKYNEFVMELMSRAVTVHSILVNNAGGGLQSDVSRNLTDNTGGIYRPIVAANALPEVHTELATAMGAHYDEVKDRLRLVFECEDDTSGAGMSVRVQRQGLTVSLFPDRRRAQ